VAIDNRVVRSRIGWAIGLLMVIGPAGWFAYREVAKWQRKEADAREDAARLKMARYHDALMDIDSIGDSTDNIAIRDRCRNAIMLLAKMEPDMYETYRLIRPASNWLNWSPTAPP
jgi:hypothetical protein